MQQTWPLTVGCVGTDLNPVDKKVYATIAISDSGYLARLSSDSSLTSENQVEVRHAPRMYASNMQVCWNVAFGVGAFFKCIDCG